MATQEFFLKTIIFIPLWALVLYLLSKYKRLKNQTWKTALEIAAISAVATIILSIIPIPFLGLLNFVVFYYLLKHFYRLDKKATWSMLVTYYLLIIIIGFGLGILFSFILLGTGTYDSAFVTNLIGR